MSETEKRPLLNAQTFKSIKPEDKEFFQRAGEVPGLFLRVRPSGAMSWVYRFRLHSKPDKVTLGPADPSGRKGLTLKEARDLAGTHRKLVSAGKNPRFELERKLAQEKANTISFAQVFDDLYQGGTHGESRPEESIQIFDRDLRAELKVVPIVDFGPVHFAKITSGPTWRHATGSLKHGKIAAAYRLIKKTIRHAISRGLLTDDPLRYSPAKSFGGKTGVEERNLGMSEIRNLFTQLTFWHTREANRRLLKFTLACGQRISAVLEMRRTEVDIDNGTWRIPKTAANRRTKSKDSRVLPLSQYMLQILRAQLAFVGTSNELVWPATNGKQIFPASVRRCIEDNLSEIEGFTPHDLRRTFVSRLHERAAQLRINAADIERVVGHALPGMMAIYAHPDPDDPLCGQRDVLNAWGKLLTTIELTCIRSIIRPWAGPRGTVRRIPFL